ncbi:hypothetical protein K32_14910 [Kaistia sp. 32K]|uniref:hypothetical protein n=1 Tax=Kaistia sp. 32K TaxID=2795690 RepID=UPI001916BF1C|nr:hypothetical protein [Kaistia sp. 32K]BCP52874.1 hypothetical protein K32_14910 [Kaistia sp. 32K]
MNFPPDDDSAGIASSGAVGCPFHPKVPTNSEFDDWLQADLRCSAGKREFQLGRYTVAHVRNGYQFSEALNAFRLDVEDYRKTGFLAIVETQRSFTNSEDELRLLAQIMVDAGLAESAGALVNSETVAIPFEVTCPVTGIPTVYEFFPVAFCPHAAVVADPLYDPALSTPFLAINTTSDAFAFGMLVRDLCQRHFHCAPHEVTERRELERLLHKCATAWQKMSINTIQGYQKISATFERAVHLSDDQQSWTAPHNDPVFAELAKEPHDHEMPIVYANRLCERWLAALFDGQRYQASRDGQSGGIPAFDFRK